MRTLAQVGISMETTLADLKIAKEAIKAIKNSVDGGDSALKCMELESEVTYQVTTYGDYGTSCRDCDLKRITPLQIEVSVQFGVPHLQISWLAEGEIDGNCCLAKISAYAIWENGWYLWDNCGDNGAPKTPYAEVYIKEQITNCRGNSPATKTRTSKPD